MSEHRRNRRWDRDGPSYRDRREDDRPPSWRRERSRSRSRSRSPSPDSRRRRHRDRDHDDGGRKRQEDERKARMARLRMENEEEERRLAVHTSKEEEEEAERQRRPEPTKDFLTVQEEDLDGLDEEEQMKMLLGFSGGFGSTSGNKVEDNQNSAASGAAAKNKARKYRQYMNRKNGFNRPLDKMD